jgi:hypothetical protein
VKLLYHGFDGCVSDTLKKTIAIGDHPKADLLYLKLAPRSRHALRTDPRAPLVM